MVGKFQLHMVFDWLAGMLVKYWPIASASRQAVWVEGCGDLCNVCEDWP